MKKHLLLGMAAIASWFATSCQNEIDSVSAGKTSTVSFKVETPEIKSRAFSDGKTATVLQYAVYDAAGNELKDLTVTDGKINLSTTVNLQLTTGNTYSVIFWAAAPDAPYTVDFAAKTMTVDYDNAVSNAENRDAFYKYHEFTVKGAQTETIELKRPFAQLNIGTNDYEASKSAGYVPTHSSVKVSNVYKKLNLKDGRVTNKAEFTVNGGTSSSGNGITINGGTANGNESSSEEPNLVLFASNSIPVKYNVEDNTFTYSEEFPVTGYEYLAMNYLLVAADKETVDVEFTYTDGDDAKTRTVGSVPVQRNYRTNIYGNLLTSNVDFNVEIKPEYNEPAHELDALHKAALNGGTITLSEDVVLTTPLEVLGEMTINLNGHTITNASNYAIENYSDLTITGEGSINGLGGIRSRGGKVTIEGGNYTCSSNWSTGTYNHILKAVNTEVVINGGTFDATVGGTNNAMINVSENSVVTINGGSFNNVAKNSVIPQFAPYMFTYEKNGKLIINGGDFYGGWRFNGEATTTDIYGGTFAVSYDGQSFHAASTHVLTIYGGAFSLENGAKLNPAGHLATGYKAVLLDGLYYVLPEVVANAATGANVTTITESTTDVATALATDNGEATMFMWNDVAYIAKYGEVVIASSADEATTVRGVVEYATSLTKATVAEGIEVVGNRTFRKCANLTTVELPNTLTEIGPAVFQSCGKLANVTIPASVTTIGEGAFAECTSLTSINIPDGITRLEKDVLRNTGLVSIEIPASVNYIGTYAFRDCESLTEVKILSPEFTIENNSFTNMAAPVPTMTIYVVNAEMKAYLESVLTNYDKSYITVSVM